MNLDGEYLLLHEGVVGCNTQDSKPVTVGEATKQEESKNDESKMEEVVLVDDDLAKIVVTEKVLDSIWGAGYKVSVENKSDKKLIIQIRDISVDGTMETPTHLT